ncbi:Methyltransferase type 11 [hydrothermal vent metagenome]|uniref:Methyltransferase type 11 n=1 Tax=hydrothermal vent metagenome TaxID=652676 RepID=A0A3B1CLK4_9ZZZZ
MKIRDSGMPKESYWESFFNPYFILSQLQLDNSITDVAEFGSGYGTFSIPAASLIRDTLYALDIDPEMTKSLRNKIAERNVRNIKVIETDFASQGTGLNDNSVEYVMLFNILHAKKPVKLLKEAKRILRQNGKVGIIHWNYDSSSPRGPSMEIRPKPEQCKNWIEQAGFKINKGPISLPPYHYGIIGIKR